MAKSPHAVGVNVKERWMKIQTIYNSKHAFVAV